MCSSFGQVSPPLKAGRICSWLVLVEWWGTRLLPNYLLLVLFNQFFLFTIFFYPWLTCCLWKKTMPKSWFSNLLFLEPLTMTDFIPDPHYFNLYNLYAAQINFWSPTCSYSNVYWKVYPTACVYQGVLNINKSHIFEWKRNHSLYFTLVNIY